MPESSDAFGLPDDAAGRQDHPAHGYCTDCGAEYNAGQAYCGRCGRQLGQSQPRQEFIGQPPVTEPAPFTGASGTTYPGPTTAFGPNDDAPYGQGATVGAVLLALFMPFISLIVALVMRSQEPRPRRRQFLKNWAIGSAAWLCTGFLIPIIAISAVSSVAVSGCQGGIDQTVLPSYQSTDGVHWTATYSCLNGGTETKSVPSSQVPGGGG
jgi:hypothetical protein